MSKDIKVRVVVDNTQAKKKLKETGGATKTLKKDVLGLKGANLGPMALAAGFTALLAVGKKAVDLAREQVRVEKQLDAVLKSTGGAAGLSAGQIKAMATELQGITNYGDEVTLAGQNLLLTFTNIGSNVFPAATRTMLDMSTALGQDLKSSAIQLGKALNDPVLGATALQRVGVLFTEQQKEQIETMVEAGDVVGAQTLILNELNREFGGSAEAAREADGGFIAAKNSAGDLSETIGKQLLPTLKDVNEFIIRGAEGIRGLFGSRETIANLSQVKNQLDGLVIARQQLEQDFRTGVLSKSEFEAQLKVIDDLTEQLELQQRLVHNVGTAWQYTGEAVANATGLEAQLAIATDEATTALLAQAEAQRQAGLAAGGNRYAAQAEQLYGLQEIHRNVLETQGYLTDNLRNKEEEAAADVSDAWQQAYDERVSAAEGAASSVLGAAFGTVGGLGLGLGEDVGRAVAEDARRLGAIAAGDFSGEAAQLLAQSNPELFKKVMESEDKQAVAREILNDFQMGIDQYGLIDKEAAKERISKLLFAGEQKQALMQELTQELLSEGQYSAAAIQQATTAALGLGGGVAAIPEDQQQQIDDISTAIGNIGLTAEETAGVVTGAFETTEEPILNLQEGLREVIRILERVDTVATTATGSVTGLGNSVGLGAEPTGGGPGTGAGYQHGGSFIVPPGYPGDSFPMRVSSGERVTVTPPGAAQNITVPVYLDGQVIAQVVSRNVGRKMTLNRRLGGRGGM